MGREAAHARVEFSHGIFREARIEHCRGSEGRPMSDADISEKTLGQLLIAFPADAAERILDACWRIEELPRVDALSPQFAAAIAD